MMCQKKSDQQSLAKLQDPFDLVPTPWRQTPKTSLIHGAVSMDWTSRCGGSILVILLLIGEYAPLVRNMHVQAHVLHPEALSNDWLQAESCYPFANNLVSSFIQNQ